MSRVPDSARPATRIVHAGLDPDPYTGGVVPAIHQATTYVQRAPGEFVEGYDYSRAANPTRAALETALGVLEGGLGTAFASGMAAEHALITAHCSAGDHVVLPDDLYGGTYRMTDKILKRWGLDYTIVDQSDLAAVEAAVQPGRTKLVWVETPTNPTLKVVDVAAIVERAHGALVAVDNTFATPVNQRPLELGAGASVHSATKYLGGHSDAVLGAVVVSDPELHEKIRFVQLSLGAVPGPLDCFLIHRGIRTLHLRMAQHAVTAQAVVEFLRSAGVEQVFYPGYGGMVSFRHPDALRIAASTRIFSLAESLGGVESLIEVPQAMTHQSVEGSAAAVPPDLVRLSCGIEAAEDLVEDLRQALGA
ncbi:MAG TPA: PLP-dependent transferase [Solirubrobacteraceae bacterium]|nr:PLP-dependent transferase [Solirubrobacteraceae bacterium]